MLIKWKVGFVIWLLILSMLAIESRPTKAEQNIQRSLSDVLGRKIRLATWQGPDEILRGVKLADVNGDIDYDYNSSDPGDYDVIMLFVKDWDDVFNFPYAESLGYTHEGLAHQRMINKDFDSAASSIKLLSHLQSNGHILQTIIYNVSNLEDMPLTCLSMMLIDSITNPTPDDMNSNYQQFINCKE